MESIAIVGMACRFPGAASVDEFWQVLNRGIETITFFSPDELDRGAVSEDERLDPAYVRARGIIQGVETFDAGLFGLTPREAALTDPQHRLLLECAYEALEDAGYDAASFAGLIGMFAGAGANTYLLRHLAPAGELRETSAAFQALTHNKHDHLTTRAAYRLNLRGPCVTVQTACSTSLVATVLACQALATFQCDMALAGGVNVSVPQNTGYLYYEGGIASRDGHCRPFDSRADGTLASNGCGVVTLKRLTDALGDRDTIHAVLRGWAVNNDGARKVGYAAPGVDSQAEVIAMAQAMAGVSADRVGYVEAHGTGTRLGDPIEIQALTTAFRRTTARRAYCGVGSVKGNLGHLDAAAGVAGLIKAVLALKHKQIPPSLHFIEANPQIDFSPTPLRVVSRLEQWEASEGPRCAGVSSFGLGGTNAHVVLEEAADPPNAIDKGPQLLILSARTGTALEALTGRLVNHLAAHPADSLDDIAYTLHVGRTPFPHRRVLVARDASDATEVLKALTPSRVLTRYQPSVRRPVVFMFPGQGAQYVGMARGLYATQPVYRDTLDRCLRCLDPELSVVLQRLLTGAPELRGAANDLDQTALAQPALFSVEFALATMWIEWGIQPSAMIGHSVGEFVAATLAGVFSLPEALAVIAKRAALIQQLPTGCMTAVSLNQASLRSFLSVDLDLAAVNGPELCVVSGSVTAIDHLENALSADRVAYKRLRTSHAFHSFMVEPVLEEFRAHLQQITLREPTRRYLSTVSGTWATPEQVIDREYWVRHVRRTVRFHEAVCEAIKMPDAVFLEVGPGRALQSLVRWHPEKRPDQFALASLPNGDDVEEGGLALLQTVGQLWLIGAAIDWQAYHKGSGKRRVPLPTYPFERRRHWIDAPSAVSNSGAPPRVTKRAEISQWFWVPVWRESPQISAQHDANDRWIVFADRLGFGDRFLEWLRSNRKTAIAVYPGEQFLCGERDFFTIDPDRASDYLELTAALNKHPGPACHFVHAWTAGAQPVDPIRRGMTSMMLLAHALSTQGNGQADFTLVTAGMQNVVGGDVTEPVLATSLGACRVIPRQFPRYRCRSIDLNVSDLGAVAEKDLIAQLSCEVNAACQDSAVAYRSGRRWVLGYDRLTVPPVAAQEVLRPAGAYLITGGLGGIGTEIAKWLGKTARARLILTGRSKFPQRERWDAWLREHEPTDVVSRKIRTVRALEALGATVEIVRADATSEADMHQLIHHIETRYGRLDGVFHAAGVAPAFGSAFPNTSSRSVLESKVRSALVLEKVLAGRRLDFLVLCSSRTGIIGRFGQADYTGGNAFLDAFAPHYQAATGTRTVSIDWGRWEDVGMAADARGTPARASGGVQLTNHVMLHRCLQRSPTYTLFATDLSVSTHWPLDEHRIVGRAVLPGVAYIEMVRAAIASGSDVSRVVIDEIIFVEPLHLNDDEVRECRLELTADGTDNGAVAFTIWSWANNNPAGRMIRHAVGRAVIRSREALSGEGVAEIRRRCSHTVEISSGDGGDDFGPRWQCVERVHVGQNEVLIEAKLPDAFQDDWECWFFHPAVIDRIAGVTRATLAPGSYYLPLTHRGVTLAAPLNGRLYAHGRFHPEDSKDGETLSFSFVVMKADGEVVLSIDRLTQKRVSDAGGRIRGLAADESVVDDVAAGDGIRPEEGVEAMARILGTRMGCQVVVSPNDLMAAMAEDDVDAAKRQLELTDAPPSAHTLRPAVGAAYVAPRNEVESKLASIWSAFLGVAQIGVLDNFFELGGDSLVAVQIIGKVRDAGLQVTPQQFFEHGTIAALAELLRKQSAANEAREVPAEKDPKVGSGPEEGGKNEAPLVASRSGNVAEEWEVLL